jgi:hypothetical protein
MSSDIHSEDIGACLTAGFSDHLSAMVDSELLYEKLASAARGR